MVIRFLLHGVDLMNKVTQPKAISGEGQDGYTVHLMYGILHEIEVKPRIMNPIIR